MKKRLLAGFLALMLLFSLAACGEAPEEVSSSGSDSAAGETGSFSDTDSLFDSSETLSDGTDAVTDGTGVTDSASEEVSSDEEADAEDGDLPSDGDEVSGEEDAPPPTGGEPSLGGDDAPPSEGTSGSSGTASGNTGSSSGNTGSSSGLNREDTLSYDPGLEHKFLATDIRGHSVVLYDLNLCNGNYSKLITSECVIWEWCADTDPNCKLNVGAGIDSAKYRYSEYYCRDVIIATSSSGWAGVIDFEERTVLWEYMIGSGPHSIEMMPNGDVVVASSGGSTEGKVSYVPLSAGVKKPSSEIHAPSGHGVSYDPKNDLLWVLEYEQVFACKVEGYGTANAKLVRISGSGYDFGAKNQDTSGHVLSPKYGEPGKYWVAGKYLWIFDTATGTLTKNYSHSEVYNKSSSNWMKGVAYFEDGTMIQTVPKFGGQTTYDWSCGGFRITILEPTAGPGSVTVATTYDVVFDRNNREFYKVFSFNKNYQ